MTPTTVFIVFVEVCKGIKETPPFDGDHRLSVTKLPPRSYLSSLLTYASGFQTLGS